MPSRAPYIQCNLLGGSELARRPPEGGAPGWPRLSGVLGLVVLLAALPGVAAASPAASPAESPAVSAARRSAVETALPGGYREAQRLLTAHPPEVQAAAALLAPLCAAGHAPSCALTGELLLATLMGEEAEGGAQGEVLLRRACELGDLRACVRLGEAALQRAGALRFEEAHALFARACDGGEPGGCAAAARAWLVARSRGWAPKVASPPDPTALLARVRELLEARCADEDPVACRDVATALLAQPDAPADYALAAELVQRACERGDADACAVAGLCEHRGCAGAPSPERAAARFVRACELHSARGCSLLAAQRARAGADDEALHARERACELRSGQACHELGDHFDGSRGGPRDLPAAARFARLACALGHPGGCTSLGRLQQLGVKVPADQPTPLARYLQVCDGAGWCDEPDCREAVGEACNSAAVALSQGQDVAPDPVRAHAYFERACLLGNRLACQSLGRPPR